MARRKSWFGDAVIALLLLALFGAVAHEMFRPGGAWDDNMDRVLGVGHGR